MAKLSASDRKSIPKSQMGVPGKATKKEGAAPGSYPMPDRAHAANAKARVAQHGTPAEKKAVNAKANRILGKK